MGDALVALVEAALLAVVAEAAAQKTAAAAAAEVEVVAVAAVVLVSDLKVTGRQGFVVVERGRRGGVRFDGGFNVFCERG